MADAWVNLLIGGTLLLVGFAAALLFQRFRVPDFFFLMVLGVVLAHLPFEPFGPGLLASLEPVLPVFLPLTLAFIMFEGGLSLSAPEGRKGFGALLAHIVVAMAITIGLTWFLATRVLGFDSTTGLVLAAAFSGPSASIVLSFAPQLRLHPKALNVIVLEGVLGNIVAAIVVMFVIRSPGQAPMLEMGDYLFQILLATGLGLALGAAWRPAVRRLPSARFVYIATLAWAIVVYALAEGFISRSGPVAAFAFGLVLAASRRTAVPGGEGTSRTERAEGLKAFQGEITFVMRTFFFVYLGLTLTPDLSSLTPLYSALVLTAGFVVARVPSSVGVARAYGLSRREGRVLVATVGRGLTDIVLVLFAIESGAIPAADVLPLQAMLPLVILAAAGACAGMLLWAERGASEARRAEAARVAMASPEAAAAASRRESPPGPRP